MFRLRAGALAERSPVDSADEAWRSSGAGAEAERRGKEAKMIKATQIKLARAEGRPHECVTVTVDGRHGIDVFYAAEQILSRWAATAPDTGGYDKCDFEVEYEDGETYDGRYDLVREDTTRFNKLGEHIRRFQEFCAGLYRPDHLSEEQYAAALRRQGGPSEAAKGFLAKYQIGIACQHEFTGGAGAYPGQIIDLGPLGGDRGGDDLAAGTPEEVVPSRCLRCRQIVDRPGVVES